MNFFAVTQQHYREPVGTKLLVQLACEIDGMPGIGETDLFVFGSGILRQHVAGFEIYGNIVIKHCPYAFGCEHLRGFVGVFVGLFYKNSWSRSAHVCPLTYLS